MVGRSVKSCKTHYEQNNPGRSFHRSKKVINMDEDIDSLNKVLRSLVVSTPTQVDVRTLLRDYKNMMGKTLPISKFGYKDPVLFLKENCSDSFVFQGPTSNPILVLIQNDSIKHIDKLVQKQRIPSSNKFKGNKRRSVAESKIKSPPSSNIRSFEIRSSERNRQITVNGDVPASQPVPPPPVHHHVQNKHKADSVPYDASLQNLYNKALFNSRRSSSEKSTHDRDSRADDDSGRQTLSSTSSSKRTQLEELKQQVSDIISDHSEGVWATDLLGLYRERYQCELDFMHYGFTSILSLVYTLEHTNVSRQPNGDWLLSDARAPPPLRPLQTVRRRVPPPVDPDDALPGIPYAADVYPEDCLNYLESIPSPSFANVEPGGMLEVAVGEVYSPSHFWLYRLGEDHNIAMENIMDEINQYYKHGEGKDRRLSRGAVRVGQYCSSCFEGDWHRSLIVKIVDSDTVKVRHVDYGTVDHVSVQGLRPLPRTWAKLEAQALRARLAGARPSAEGRRWPRAAAHYFLRLVRDKKFIANVVAVDPEDNALEVLLIDTSISEDKCITNELISSGHADRREDSTVGTSECYLFPRFAALESADTPNFSEIHAYLRDGIDLDCVADYRRHVPPSLPAPRVTPPLDPLTPASPSPTTCSPRTSPSLMLTRIPLRPDVYMKTPKPPPYISSSHSNIESSYTPRCLAPSSPTPLYPPGLTMPPQFVPPHPIVIQHVSPTIPSTQSMPPMNYMFVRYFTPLYLNAAPTFISNRIEPPVSRSNLNPNAVHFKSKNN